MNLHEILREMEALNIKQAQFHSAIQSLASLAADMLDQGEYHKVDKILVELNKTISEYLD